MADVLTPEQRHKNMQHIKSNDTKIEVLLRKALWQKGYRYRKNYKELLGKPDIVLKNIRLQFSVRENFFMARIGKYSSHVLRNAIIVNSGLTKYPEMWNGTMR